MASPGPGRPPWSSDDDFPIFTPLAEPSHTDPGGPPKSSSEVLPTFMPLADLNHTGPNDQFYIASRYNDHFRNHTPYPELLSDPWGMNLEAQTQQEVRPSAHHQYARELTEVT
jgi:hypothetical protein